eukprot:Lankesteria_metandrocarpae@DN6171_c0_g1_i1.p1
MVGAFSSSENMADNQPPKVVTLTNSKGMKIVLMDVGATWMNCIVPMKDDSSREVCLGVSSAADFLKQDCYFGATVGRYANRIENGKFAIDGSVYQVKTNQFGNCLHGGPDGFDKRRWKIDSSSSSSVTFQMTSPDGDQGFPGELQSVVTYTLGEDNGVRINFKAQSTKPTVVNMTNHAYFHLDGADSGHTIHNMKLQIDSDEMMPVSEQGLPSSSEPVKVDGTSFDFKKGKTIGEDMMKDFQKKTKGYDHGFVLKSTRDLLKPVATVHSIDNKLRMDVHTSSPALQFYGGNWLSGQPKRTGGVYDDYSGLALEIGFLADFPNHPEFHPEETCVVRPGKDFKQFVSYTFEAL